MSDLFENHIVGFPMRTLIYVVKGGDWALFLCNKTAIFLTCLCFDIITMFQTTVCTKLRSQLHMTIAVE